MNEFPSLDQTWSGKVKAYCGHVVDVRTLVYWHCPHGVTAMCKDCGPDEALVLNCDREKKSQPRTYRGD